MLRSRLRRRPLPRAAGQHSVPAAAAARHRRFLLSERRTGPLWLSPVGGGRPTLLLADAWTAETRWARPRPYRVRRWRRRSLRPVRQAEGGSPCGQHAQPKPLSTYVRDLRRFRRRGHHLCRSRVEATAAVGLPRCSETPQARRRWSATLPKWRWMHPIYGAAPQRACRPTTMPPSSSATGSRSIWSARATFPPGRAATSSSMRPRSGSSCMKMARPWIRCGWWSASRTIRRR